ncbi:hypothetical protein SC1083_0938 [Aggregatibacter actinomycetemcomitans serotype e str. SC1083]|uniref:Uncharacterized protein n=1 Tax=Aggregatibacter actinomycetemcomitans serotype e str. SC1083 TaxID=907488 RepID=G4A7Z2_AGGAC|nr:hypothetical protein SC1083_0938 [Aggregatibacter actinomycetemcomitans serotype e str. SC1083]
MVTIYFCSLVYNYYEVDKYRFIVIFYRYVIYYIIDFKEFYYFII